MPTRIQGQPNPCGYLGGNCPLHHRARPASRAPHDAFADRCPMRNQGQTLLVQLLQKLHTYPPQLQTGRQSTGAQSAHSPTPCCQEGCTRKKGEVPPGDHAPTSAAATAAAVHPATAATSRSE